MDTHLGILIVEDKPDLATNLVDYLEARGRLSDATANGISGLHPVTRNAYDVMIPDLALPGLDGVSLCQCLREEAGKLTPSFGEEKPRALGHNEEPWSQKESPRRPCISRRMMVEEVKSIPRSFSLIFGTPRTAFRCFMRRLCLVSTLIIGTLVVPPAALADQFDNPEGIRVRRMPDTWQVTATDTSIYFAQGSSSIGADAAQLIRRYAAKLRAMPGFQLTLIAHTGDLGSSSLELARGQDRLEAVRKRLEDLKVPFGRIRTENHGSESRNTQPCTDDECLSRNRRVDILLHR